MPHPQPQGCHCCCCCCLVLLLHHYQASTRALAGIPLEFHASSHPPSPQSSGLLHRLHHPHGSHHSPFEGVSRQRTAAPHPAKSLRQVVRNTGQERHVSVVIVAAVVVVAVLLHHVHHLLDPAARGIETPYFSRAQGQRGVVVHHSILPTFWCCLCWVWRGCHMWPPRGTRC